MAIYRGRFSNGVELALVVEDDRYLPGLGVGWTADGGKQGAGRH